MSFAETNSKKHSILVEKGWLKSLTLDGHFKPQPLRIAGCGKPRLGMILECGNMRQDLFKVIVYLPGNPLFGKSIENMCRQYIPSGNLT